MNERERGELPKLKRSEYEQCRRMLDGQGMALWERFASGQLGEGRYALLDDKLAEWEAELERKRPLLSRRKVG